ncbi:MAG: peptidoglycan editing factor PgeF [Proteobacteria bacterium]|nr:peptidoglycan editing factor PgeF [Pseudomonadota bacterium]
MKFELKHIGDWSYYYIPKLEETGIAHGFFTKDSPSHMLEGQKKEEFLHAFFLKDAIVMNQEHGDMVHIVRNGDKPASGDGIILIEKGMAGIIKTADCLPVIIAESGYPMVSIIHAGWRGTVKKIVQKAVHAMTELGAEKKHMTALLGPSISSCCYEVGQDVYTAFQNKGFSGGIFRKPGESLFLNIRQANREILENAGIKNIFDINLCTFCSKDLFHSYRRGETEKRQINFVSLME